MEKYKEWALEQFQEPLNEMMNADFGIFAMDGAKTPICKLPKSIGNPQTEHLITKQKKNALLIAAAPIMLHALEMAQYAIPIEDNAYESVINALKAAKGGER